MTLPSRWTTEQFKDDAAIARNFFREERVGEPLDLYNEFFVTFAALFRSTIAKLPDLVKNPVDPALVASLVKGKVQQKTFRYLAAPPISEDDLKAVADTSLAPGVLKVDADKATRVRDTILSILDPHRFPWAIPPARNATAEETERAVIASAALAAAREVETHRRTSSKTAQESAVKNLLLEMGLVEVPPRDIPILTKAPEPGHFCGESRLAGTRADVVARLNDGRVLAIECKVSNSTVNSYKRLVHDTGGKAAVWYQQLGRAQVIPMAVLSGVFHPGNCEQVQNDGGVYLVWQHRLEDLQDFVSAVA